jgi:hypothetical protein
MRLIAFLTEPSKHLGIPRPEDVSRSGEKTDRAFYLGC